MPTPASTLKLVRQIHLYFGIFITPALLFFALTGALQTFSLHETTQGSSYKPARWIVSLSQLHKNQTTEVPVRKPRPAPEAATDAKPRAVKQAESPAQASVLGPVAIAGPSVPQASGVAPPVSPATPPPAPKRHLPMKIFFLAVAIGLFTSASTGIYMAYKFGRNKLLVTGLLAAGVVVPLLLLPF